MSKENRDKQEFLGQSSEIGIELDDAGMELVNELAGTLGRYSIQITPDMNWMVADEALSQAETPQEIGNLLANAAVLDDEKLLGDLKEASINQEDELRTEDVFALAVATAKADVVASMDGLSTDSQKKLKTWKKGLLRGVFPAGSKKLIQATSALTMAGVFLTACGPVGISGAAPIPEGMPPTATSGEVTASSPTSEPTAIEVQATPTETQVPTPEVKDYGVCETEDFRECPIPAEDLFNGEYLAFLETLSTPFDPNNMKQVPWFDDGRELRPYGSNPPYFEGMTTIGAESGADFRRGVTSGFVEFEGLPYLILPVEFYDQEHPDKNVWVIAVYPLFYFYDGDIISLEPSEESSIDAWRNLMKVTPLYTEAEAAGGVWAAALAKQTFDEDPTMEQRFSDFVAGKRSSLHGKVLLTKITYHNNPDRPIDFYN